MSKTCFSPRFTVNPLFSRIGMLSCGLLLASTAQAATITVTSASDAAAPVNACSLRGAIAAINAGTDNSGCTATGAYGSDDAIVFALPDNTIVTFASPITINKNVTIDGGNQVALDGNRATALLNISGGTMMTVANLALINGNKNGYGAAIYAQNVGHTLVVHNSIFKNNQASNGGAIHTSGRLKVRESLFDGNSASGTGGALSTTNDAEIVNSVFNGNSAVSYGGGMYNAYGHIIVTASTFSGNSARIAGGAIGAYYDSNRTEITASTFNNNSATNHGGAIDADGNVIIDTSTFTENSAVSYGGAINFGSASSSPDNTLKIIDSTWVNNRSPSPSGYYGAAIYVSKGIGSVDNSLIVGDAGVTVQCVFWPSWSSKTKLTGGTNLEWRNGSNENSCNSTHPVLVPDGMTLAQIVSPTLADNGGPTHTLALPAGSPAIDAGDPAAVIGSTDQRGQPRSQGNGPDLGAFETASLSPAPYTHVDTTTQIENGVTLTTINGQLVSYPEHVGMNTATFVFVNITGTDDWLLLNPETGWHPWVDCASSAFPYSFGTMPWVTDIALFYNADLSPFHGWPVLFGYGAGDTKEAACADMFSNTRYTRVTTL